MRPDGTLVFPESVGRAFDEPANAAAYRQAIHTVTVAALDKRIEGRLDDDGELTPRGELRLGAGTAADQFVNDGLREAYWAVHGDRICLRLSPERGPELHDAPDVPHRQVARDAALALASAYAQASHDWPDSAVHRLLQKHREEVFETVVDARLASHLRDDYTPTARDALSELRGRLTTGLREGFEQPSQEQSLPPAEIRTRVNALLEPVDESARTVKDVVRGMSAQQTTTSSAAPAAAAAKPARYRWTSFGR